MDSTTVIIGIIVLSLFAWPFWLTVQKNKRDSGGIRKMLNDLVGEHGAKLGQSDISGKTAIGIDQDKGLAFFCFADGQNRKGTCIDLLQYSDVKAQTRYNERQGAKAGSGHPDEIVLRFTPAIMVFVLNIVLAFVCY